MLWPKFFESISVFESDSDLTADNVIGLRGCCFCIRSGYVDMFLNTEKSQFKLESL